MAAAEEEARAATTERMQTAIFMIKTLLYKEKRGQLEESNVRVTV
jgi:hypothetical protein